MTEDLYTEIIKSEPMPLTSQQVHDLTEAYANHVIDGMDMDSLIQFAFESLVAELNKYTPEELVTEIEELYDSDTLNMLMEEVNQG